MSGLVFDALLPDFTVADRRESSPRPLAFVPLIARDGGGSTPFEGLAPNGRPGAGGTNQAAAREAYAQQGEPGAGDANSGDEDDLDRQWKAVEQAHEAQSETLAELTEKHEAELNSLKAVHAAEIASLTVHAIEDMEKRIAQAIQTHLVSILGALMSAQHQQKAVAQFAEKVSAMASDGRGIRLRVTGPQQLLDALRAELGDDARRFLLVPAETTELEAAIDESILSTRFSEWHDVLERVLA